MPVIDELIEGRKELNDALREEFFPANSKVEFLKASVSARQFDVVLTFYAGWFLRYSDFRQSSVLELATNEPFEKDQIRTATHLRINDDVYAITQGETIEPQGAKPYWRFSCERFLKSAQFTPLY